MTCELTIDKSLFLAGYILVFVFGTIGNFLVLVVFRKYWRKGRIIELLILYLAACDFLSSLITPVVFGYWVLTCNKWHFGFAMCKLIPPLTHIFSNCSAGFILIMALDRFRAIVTPMKLRFSRNFVHKTGVATVIISILWEWYYIRALKLLDNGNSCTVSDADEPIFTYPIIASIFLRDFIFAMIFLLTNLAVIVTLKRRKSYLSRTRQERETRTTNIVHMLLLLGAVFTLSFFPRDLFILSYQLSPFIRSPIPYTSVNVSINSALKLFQTSNSIYNVFIYAGMHEKFWKEVNLLFRNTVTSLKRNEDHEYHPHQQTPLSTIEVDLSVSAS